MSKKTTNDAVLFSYTGRPTLGQAFPLAMQHVVAMIAGCITPALIISGAAGLDQQNKIFLIQMSLIMAGIATLIQLFPLFGKVGAKLPVIIGVSFAYVPTMAAVAFQYSKMPQYGAAGAIGVILGAQLIGALVAIVFGVFIKRLMPLFPPLVTGTVVFVIGLSLYDIAVKYMGGGGAITVKGAAAKIGNYQWGDWQFWLVGALTFVAAILLTAFGKGIFKMASVLFAMIAGYLISLPFGMVDFGRISGAGWLSAAPPLHFGLYFEWPVIISFIILFIVNSIQAIGDFTSTTIGGMDRVPTEKELQGGVIAYGLTNIIGAFFNCLPFATFSQNVGIVAVNRVINRFVFAMASVIIIIAGFLPKISAVLTSIPYPVIGGATISVFAMITMNGVRLIAKQPFTPRNCLIVGISVASGMGFTSVATAAAGQGVHFMPEWLNTAIGTSPVVLATIIAVLLNLLIKPTKADMSSEQLAELAAKDGESEVRAAAEAAAAGVSEPQIKQVASK